MINFNFNSNSPTLYAITVKGLYVKGINLNNTVVGSNASFGGKVRDLYLGFSFTPSAFLSSSSMFIQSGFMAGTYTGYYPSSTGYFGSFAQDIGSDKFLGIKFDVSGDPHYGWMRFKFNAVDGSSWLLKDLAYNSVPNKAIKVGEINGVVPADPTALSATAISTSQIEVAWTDNATDEDEYKIERSLDGQTFLLLLQ